jgi:hypothetical protein
MLRPEGVARSMIMIKSGNRCASLLVFAMVGSASLLAQSLGDAARDAHNQKHPAAKVYTNDNLPTEAPISITGTPEPAKPVDAGDQAAGEDDAKAAAASNPDEAKPDEAEAARQKASEDWKQKLAAQKKDISLLERELDVMQREYRLRAAAFYADAGNRLRNQQQWSQDDQQYRSRSEQKQKQLDEAKQKLDDLKEQARKSGAPAAVYE